MAKFATIWEIQAARGVGDGVVFVRMKRWWMIVLVVVPGVVLLVPQSVRRELGWVDPVSGSRRSQTVWRFRGAAAPVVTESPLANRYRELGLKWEPQWKQIRDTSVDIFGRSVRSECGLTPEIYLLNADLRRLFVNVASDAEIRAFFRVMSGGSEAEKKAAVEGACEKGLGGDVTAQAGR